MARHQVYNCPRHRCQIITQMSTSDNRVGKRSSMFRSTSIRPSRFLIYGAALSLLVTGSAVSVNAQRNRTATESVRQGDSRHVRTAATKLMGWKVTARGDAFGQLSFTEAATKTDAAGLAFIEGFSTQKVSPEISKNLDYNLSGEE